MPPPTPSPQPGTQAAARLVAFDAGHVHVALSGEWSLKNGFPDPGILLREIVAAANPAVGPLRITLTFDCTALAHYDSSLPAYLLALDRSSNDAALALSLDTATLPTAAARMLALAKARPAANAFADSKTDAVAASSPPPGSAFGRNAESFFYRVGASATEAARSWGAALASVGETVLAFTRLLRGRARCRFREFWFFVQACGVDAFPIVGLISFLTGLILAYVGALQMRQVGAMIYVPGGVAISMMREMGVLMVAVVLCGRTATAYAAQLGSMKVSEEMAAYRSMGVSPVEYLVLPRTLALVVMMPFLTLYSNFFGIIGGLFVTTPMGVSLEQSYNMTALVMTLPTFTSGLIKSIAFAVLIGWVGCYRGMVCGKSSQAVGDAATSAAVLGITLVIITDAIFAVLFNVINFF